MLEIKNLTKIYNAKGGVETRALNDVTLRLPKTGMVFLLGKSGSGKSTLLNVCGGLDAPTEGEVIVKGRSSKSFSKSDFDSYRNTFVGFIFQEYNLLNEFTVAENVSLALELQGKSAEKGAIFDILKEVEIEELAERKPSTLSGGQKQRVAIARALVKNPEILMADEPTGALDSETGEQVFQTLKKLSKDKLVLVVSHDRDFAERYADRIIELKDGSVFSDLSKTEKGELIQTQTAPREEAEAPKFIPSRLPLKRAMRLGASGLKTKPVRLAFTLLLSVISFALFGLFSTLMLFDTEATVRKSLQNSNRAHVLLQKEFELTLHTFRFEYESWEEATEGRESRFTQADVESYKADFGEGVFGVVSRYGDPDNLAGVRAAYVKMEWATVVNFSYLPEEHPMRESILHGEYPTKEGEILVSEYVAYGIMARGFKDGQQTPKSMEEVVGKTLDLDGNYCITGVFESDLEGFIQEYNALVQGASATREEYNQQNESFLGGLEETLNGVAFVCKADFDKAVQAAQGGSDMISEIDEIMRWNSTNVYFGDDAENLSPSARYHGAKMLPLQAEVCGSRDLKEGEMIVSPSFLKEAPYLAGVPDLAEKTLTIDGQSLPYSTWASALDENAFVVWDSGRTEIPYPRELRQKIAEALLREVQGLTLNGRNTVWNSGGGYYSLVGLSRQLQIAGVAYNPSYFWSVVYVDDVTYAQMREESYVFRGEGMDFKEQWAETSYVEQGDMIYDKVFLPYDHSRRQTDDLKAFTFDFKEDKRVVPCNALVYNVLRAGETVEKLSTIFLWIGIITVGFSALLLSNFISISIVNKKREIGILRALGARGVDVFKIFMVESLVIALSCACLGIVVSLIGCGIFNGLLGTALSNVSLLVFRPLAVLIILSVALLTATIATLLPVCLTVRKKPVDSIRA